MNLMLSLALWLSKRQTILAVFAANTRYLFSARKTHITRKGEFFQVRSPGLNIHFPNLSRGIWIYRDGIPARLLQIEEAYCLASVELESKDIVIDCGANFGDFALAVIGKSVTPHNLHLFEPSLEEFRALQMTFPKCHAYQLALGESEGARTFFVSPQSGDSSLHEPADGYLRKIDVMVEAIDNLPLPPGPIKLMKIEAEGGEPEVILGASKTLDRVEYVALDGGAERGLEKISTWMECLSLLESKGFQVVAMSKTREKSGLLRKIPG